MRRGQKATPETRAKQSVAIRAALESSLLSANEIDYSALHKWLRKAYPKTGTCEKCGRTPHTGRTDYALIQGREYSRNREDYRELCVRCHRIQDSGSEAHGTRGTYNRGCRCDECRAFNTKRCREIRERRIERELLNG